MSQKSIKVTLPPMPLSDDYQKELRREFEHICTLIDELILWAEFHAPSEIKQKLRILKSFTEAPFDKTN
jgi:hypothetical protein